MIPSNKQQAIYDAWTTTDENIVIKAVAGSGKTSTLLGILERSQYKTLFLAFNKSIQEDIQAKIEAKGFKHGKALTVHALGLKAVIAHYGQKNVTVNTNKSWQILKDLERFNRRIFKSLIWEDKAKINMTIIEMNDISRLFMTNDVKEIFKAMSEMDKYFFDHPQLSELWTEFISLREERYNGKVEVDFIDMIFLPVREQMRIPIDPYYLLVDECQDLNIAQHQFISLLVGQGDIKKMIAVGDRNQSIYGFSGASGNSFDMFIEKPNTVELPLSICYRCPQLIIDEANAVYDVMEGFKEEAGIVGRLSFIDDIQGGSMIICRNTSPLIILYFQLLAQKRKVYLKGEDILNSLTKFLKPYNYKSVSETKRKLTSELLQLDKVKDKSDEQRFKYYRMKQNLANFTLLVENIVIGDDKVEVMLQSLNSMFHEIPDEEAITLCTIHKSKGLEADIVYILNEFLIPSKFAKSPMQLEQERNLKYVARTRAKKELYYLNLRDTVDEEDVNLIP